MQETKQIHQITNTEKWNLFLDAFEGKRIPLSDYFFDSVLEKIATQITDSLHFNTSELMPILVDIISHAAQQIKKDPEKVENQIAQTVCKEKAERLLKLFISDEWKEHINQKEIPSYIIQNREIIERILRFDIANNKMQIVTEKPVVSFENIDTSCLEETLEGGKSVFADLFTGTRSIIMNLIEESGINELLSIKEQFSRGIPVLLGGQLNSKKYQDYANAHSWNKHDTVFTYPDFASLPKKYANFLPNFSLKHYQELLKGEERILNEYKQLFAKKSKTKQDTSEAKKT